MRLRIFITMNLSCVGILFFFQCGGCDAVLQLRHQSTPGRPLQHHQVFSISYFPLFINLFHCVCLISVHVCLLVDLQTEVVLGVTWSLTRTCFELSRTLASKCHLVSDSMLGMNFQGSVRKYKRGWKLRWCKRNLLFRSTLPSSSNIKNFQLSTWNR